MARLNKEVYVLGGPEEVPVLEGWGLPGKAYTQNNSISESCLKH